MELRRTRAVNQGGSLIDALASVSEAELREAVVELAKPRHMFHQRAENRRAAQYVASALEERGYAGEIEGDLGNVVAMPRGAEDRPLILVGAHYDSVPGTPGADDNASGIAAMLACARALAHLDPALPVGFVAWNGEEDGLLGSVEFVARRRSVRAAPRSIASFLIVSFIVTFLLCGRAAVPRAGVTRGGACCSTTRARPGERRPVW